MYISIGIPFFNAEKYLEDAIKSVLAQTFKNWELILVDDGSTDRSLEIAQSFVDPRIRIISDGYNRRLPYRLNQIINEAKYGLIARMDADDLMAVDRLEKQVKVLNKNPEIDLVVTSLYSIGNKNEILGKRIFSNHQMQPKEILQGLTNLLHPSLLARKAWCQRNPYQIDNCLAEDYELWLSAAIKNDFNYLVMQEPLYFYREVENVKKEKMVRGYNTQIKVIKKYYKNTISDIDKNKIILKFQVKKIVVKILNFLNLMQVLQIRRITSVSDQDKDFYASQLEIIERIK
ncbi:glycosyltransferase family 2 protein [Acinetobacter pseudolwoffii]|uniref:glycosyltransferase family 2 protein n=1 Tax=Acinetobacter pseudolwoffii TaxID=2053287 RepID=UPI0025779E39|nr:glycosyltransferase family 2 protein [Acinetobacter pseudolwoffii]MDM1342060.1 glycosyltransferase family 2 protein [Acinetobacter pseudolwoffii]